jgi:hypothetical protein
VKIHIQGEAFEVDPGKLTFGEAKRIEAVTGQTFSQWGDLLQNGSITALQALVWTLMRRTRPEVRFDDVDDIEFGQVSVEADEEPEAKKPAGRAARSRQVDPTQTV